jgi:hypothetical protein
MTHKNKLIAGSTLLLILCLVTAIEAKPHRFMGRKEFLPYTRNLPAVDQIELFKLTLKEGVNGEHWNGEMDASKVLRGSEARKLASLWRNQTYTPNQSACHEPVYAIKFYAKGKLLAYATVCWSCNNIRFITPELNGEQNFAGGDRRGEQLSEVFRLAFIATK